MRPQTQGRQDLLTWINEFTECDYPKIELLSDGIAYCQLLDAIHPGCVQLQKLNYTARFPDEYTRNLRILDDGFSKLKIDRTVPIDKLSKSKFQDNMQFLQWLFNYASKIGPFANKQYRGYHRRLEAFEKQGNGKYSQMSAHLIPNTEFLKFRNDLTSRIESMKGEVDTRSQIEDILKDLESDVKNKMEYNWKLVYALDDMLYQRNVLYNLISKIESLVEKDQSVAAIKIMNAIKEQPIDFSEMK